MASLQGFQEVSLTAPISKSVMTVTDLNLLNSVE